MYLLSHNLPHTFTNFLNSQNAKFDIETLFLSSIKMYLLAHNLLNTFTNF